MANSVAVFIFAGFLESGKTTALQGMLLAKKEILDGKSVIISTEDGEDQLILGFKDISS
jgi:G3E family GTPase